MSNKPDGFMAGVSFVVVFTFVVSIIRSHGDVADTKPVTWTEIGVVLLGCLVLALCIIDLYKYFKGIE